MPRQAHCSWQQDQQHSHRICSLEMASLILNGS
uniref:Uncharacterized protein n=1 Tax=Arundo donax TaxID=35708 RepID=A0A0A9A8Y4_ARUDO